MANNIANIPPVRSINGYHYSEWTYIYIFQMNIYLLLTALCTFFIIYICFYIVQIIKYFMIDQIGST